MVTSRRAVPSTFTSQGPSKEEQSMSSRSPPTPALVLSTSWRYGTTTLVGDANYSYGRLHCSFFKFSLVVRYFCTKNIVVVPTNCLKTCVALAINQNAFAELQIFSSSINSPKYHKTYCLSFGKPGVIYDGDFEKSIFFCRSSSYPSKQMI